MLQLTVFDASTFVGSLDKHTVVKALPLEEPMVGNKHEGQGKRRDNPLNQKEPKYWCWVGALSRFRESCKYLEVGTVDKVDS